MVRRCSTGLLEGDRKGRLNWMELVDGTGDSRGGHQESSFHLGVSENVVYPIVPGFHDHYPVFKRLFHWEY